MRMRRKMVKTTIAMLTLIAMVIETGFSSVSAYAAVFTDDSQEVNIEIGDDIITNDTSDDVLTVDSSYSDDVLVDNTDSVQDIMDEPNITITHDDITENDTDVIRNENVEVSSKGISGSGCDDISIYIDTTALDKKDTFSVYFNGPNSASYNPVLNDVLDKTNGGRYYFDDLEGGEFSIYAAAEDDVILSYDYIDGYPAIIAESATTEKNLTTRILTAVDNSKISAVSGKGYDSITVSFDTEDITDKDSFKLYVESDADATVNGKSALAGITGLDKNTGALTIEGLDNKKFIAYVVSDTDAKLETVAEIISVEDGEAVIDVNGIATKRVYEYEDSKVYVRATLEKADAIPDDAYFCVTPLSDEQAEKYLEFLNNNNNDEELVYTTDNTFLYDITFYTDESKIEEIEPEDGAVSVSIEFKQNQVSEELGVEDKADIEVNHFIEEGSGIEAETLDVEQNGEVDKVDVVTDSFSVFTITARSGSAKVNVKNPGQESAEGILGDAWIYGITANTWEFDGEAETNFAVKRFTGINDTALGGEGFHTGVSNLANGTDYQYVKVGEVNGTATIKERNCDLYIPESEKNKINGTGGCVVNKIITDKKTIDSTIEGMFTYVNGVSSRLAATDSIENYNNLPTAAYGDNNLTIDISGAPDGTYYINVDKYPALREALAMQDKVTIVKNAGQKIVFNYPQSTSVNIKCFSVKQNGQSYKSSSMASISNTGLNPIVEDCIFNLPAATSVNLETFAGIMIAPKATVKWGNGASGGWLVCNKAVSGAEWHFLNGKIKKVDPPKPGKVEFDVPVCKRFLGGEGNWKDGFTFTLERLTGDGSKVQNDHNTPQSVVLKGGDSDTATGNFKFYFDDTIPNNVRWDRNTDGSYANYEYVHTEWYRVSELKNRSDVVYDLLDKLGYKQRSNGKYYDDKGYEIDPNFWYIHLFIYKDDREGWWAHPEWNNNYEHYGAQKKIAEYKVAVRTARVNPYGWTGQYGLPCEENRTITFYNEYVKPVTVVIGGRKLVNSSYDNVPSGKFTFTLQTYAGNEKWNSTNSKYTVTNDGSYFTFPEIELDLDKRDDYVKSGDTEYYYYYYKISETNDCKPYGPDPAVFIARVTVTKKGSRLSTNTEFFRFADPSKAKVATVKNNAGKKCSDFTVEPLYFNNTYETKGQADIYGLKLLEGRDFEPDDEFTFKLMLVEGENKNVLQTKTFKVGQVADESFSFKFDTLYYDIKDDGQTYNYLVQEEAGSAAGMNYDTTEYPVTIKISDANKNGQLTIDQKKGTQSNPVTITNRYKATGEVPFYAHKIYPLNTKLSEKEVFKFQLKGGKVGEAETVNEIQSITGPGQVEFTSVKFAKEKNSTEGLVIDETGTYKYTIQEVIPEGAVEYTADPHTKIKDGIIYDARIYNVTVTVTDGKNGQLIVKKTGGYDNEPQTAIDDDKYIDPGFENDYKIESVKDPIPGTKRYPGGSLEAGMFTFKLEADPDDDTTIKAVKDGTVVLPDKTTVQNGIPTEKFKAGEFAFDDITYNAAGTYRFKITEIPGNIENVVYSTEVFYVTKVVADNGKGQLVVSKTAGLPIEFVNPLVEPGSVKLRAYKKLYGQDLQPGQFKFDLIYDGKVLETQENDKNGLVLFGEIKYDIKQLGDADSKVFSYQIKEQMPTGAKDLGNNKYFLDGMTYDAHVEDVNVTVKKIVDTSGNISIEVEEPDNATENKKAVFINEYEASGQTDFGGHKKLLGRKFEDEDEGNWQAVLYNEQGKEVQRANIVKDSIFFINHGGKFDFAPLKYTTKIVDPDTKEVTYLDYTKPVTYNFTVKEEGRKVPNVRNSEEVYNVKVTVSDDKKGHLNVVAKKYNSNGTPVDDILFTNEYTTGTSVRFHALKKTNGAELKDKMFTFELWDEATSTTKPIQTQYNDNGGEIWFDPIEYVKNDTRDDTRSIDDPYIYKIKEKIENRKGWTLATNEYTVKVWVTYNKTTQNIDIDYHYYAEDENGQLVQVDDDYVIFENTYEAYGEVTPYAEKAVTDREVPAGKFKFILTEENGKSYEATNEYAEVGKTARASFETLKFNLDSLSASDVYPDADKENTYYKYYTMVEDIPDGSLDLGNGYYKKDGYTYDGQVYIVKVILTDKGDGQIATDWFAYPAGGRLQKLTFMEKVVKFVTGNDPQKHALFTNRYDAQGSLQLSAKKVLDGKELKAGDFDFTISGDGFSYTRSNGADGIVSFNRIDYTEEGTYNYTVKEEIPEGSKEISPGIWEKDGVKYDSHEYNITVTVADKPEASKDGKLDISVAVDGKNVTTSLTVAADGSEVTTISPEELVFTNVYKPAPVTVVPGGRKDLQGRLLLDGEFEFKLVSDTGNPKDYSDKVVNQGQWFTFKEISFTPDDMKEGDGYALKKTFAYTMTETKGSLPGVTYAEQTYKFVIEITDNNGQLEAKVIRDDEFYKGEVNENEIATFYNTYEAEGTISFPVQKIVLGASEVNKDKLFKFVLEDEQTKKTYEKFLKADQIETIASFEYKLEDLPLKADGKTRDQRVYRYNVYEEVPTADGEGWTYFRDTYKAEVTVSDNGDGTLKVDPAVTINGKPYTEKILKFINKYNAEGSTDLIGKKILDYGTLKGGEFTFILEELTTDAAGKAVYANPEKVTNDANGDFAFADRHYTMDDIDKTFTYRVREDDSNPDPTIDYDNSVYDVVIKVSDNGDGTLNVDKAVSKNGTIVKNCIFLYNNKKKIEPNSIQIVAEKELQGLPLEDNMFTFRLMEGNNLIEEVKNKGTKVTFSKISYGLSDVGSTHTYEVREVIEKINGVKYDDTVKKVVAKVDLAGNKVTVDRKNFDHTGKQIDDDEIKFINEYHATVKVPVGGSKILSGFPDDASSIGQYPYTFVMYKSNDLKNPIQTTSVTPKDNKTPAEYKFEDLEFTEKDYNDPTNPQHIFEYVVKEYVPVYEKDKAPNVTYATNEYNVVVKLSIDNKKVLHADATTKENVPVDKLKFTNIYKAEGTENFPVVKHITGKELEDAAYTFTLSGNGISQTKTNDGSQVNFDPIQYTAQDIGKTYTYTIKETASKDGSTIDTREYFAEVTVKEGTGGKVVTDKQVYYLDAAGKQVFIDPGKPIEFENTYKADGTIDIEGTKVMHSKPLAGGEYSFILKDENGKEIERVTNGAASLNNKKDLEARAAFKFSPLKFTQDDLKLSTGYLSELKKYYTVEEEISNKGGITYSNAAYVVEITIKDNGNGTLTVTKDVAGQSDVKKDDTGNGLSDFLKALIGRMTGKNDSIVFENEYDSECVIDPPILIKQMFGRTLERGMFKFEITGPGLRSKNQSEYRNTVFNGYADYDKTITTFPWGEEMKVGEIYVGDIKYKFIDLDIDLDTGEASKEFVYYATEIDQGIEDITFSDQKLKLVVKVTDNNDGTMTVRNAKDLVVDNSDDDHKLFWQAVNPYTLDDEQMSDTFLNTDNKEAHIDIPGIKRLLGREFTKDDKFSFTISDEDGRSATVENTVDKDGKLGRVEFKAADIDFLNYRYGWYEKNPDRKAGDPADLYEVDDTGTYVYTIKEENTTGNSIVADTSTYKVYVKVELVKENGKEELVAKIDHIDRIYSDNNKVVFDFADDYCFEFVNEFKASGKIDFEGTKYIKELESDDVKKREESFAGKYQFALYQYDSEARTAGKKLIDAQFTDADGNYKLSVPKYDQDVLKNEKGEYETEKTLYYRIIETKPSNGTWTENNTVFESNGIIYDNTEYDVDVTIVNDGTSDLKITKKITKAATGEEVQNIDFFNVDPGVKEYTSVSGNKIWVDDVTDPKTRPDVELSLYSSAVGNGREVINTYTIKAPETTYTFKTDKAGDPLPVYDKNDKKITYTVEEKVIPGYVSEKNGYDFTNTKGHIVIQKLDESTGEPLVGATLAIFDGKTQVEKWTTGSSAHVVKATLTAGKKYILRELEAPKGYGIASDITFTVPADGSDITVTMTDVPVIGSVKLVKEDSSTRDRISGAEFALYNAAGTRIYATGSAGKYKATSTTSNGVFKTDSNGELTITDLPYGAYEFVETKAPEGYALSSERVGFTIASSSQVVEVTYLNRQSLGAVRLRKVSASGSRTLAGAQFELYCATPKTAGQAVSSTVYQDAYYRYGTYTTNSSGEIYVDDLPWDSYYFIEVKAPDGFALRTDITGEPIVYTFTVDAKTAGTTIDIGDVINDPSDDVPPDTGVLGARVKNEVLGVRSKPTAGVLGTRVGPVTGDASAIILWMTLLVACVGTIILMITSRKRKVLNK